MPSDAPLDDRYLEWLYSFVGPARNRNPARSHWLLAEQLFRMRFVWSIANDDNRIEDARQLRNDFFELEGSEPDYEWIDQDLSVLEVLIGLANRTAFDADGDPFEWFWKILENVGLRVYTDDKFDEDTQEAIDQIITTVLDRTYDPSGHGGLFPLQHPSEDQRNVELWYQMSSYLLENGFG